MKRIYLIIYSLFGLLLPMLPQAVQREIAPDTVLAGFHGKFIELRALRRQRTGAGTGIRAPSGQRAPPKTTAPSETPSAATENQSVPVVTERARI